MTEPPTLYIVACACPLTRHIDRLLTAAADANWQPVIIATPDGLSWLPRGAHDEPSAVASVPVLSNHRRPDEGKRLPAPTAVIILATANTLAKMRAGIADTYAHALLCEAISMRVPLAVVPSISSRLGGHPAYAEAIAWLRSLGALIVDPRDGNTENWQPLESGTGETIATTFDWTRILSLIADLGSSRSS